MASIDKIPSTGICPMSVRFIILLSIAIIGTGIVVVMMSIPDVRDVISYKKTYCTICNTTLETDPSNTQLTRGVLTVSFVPRYNTTEARLGTAYRTPKSGTYYQDNQLSWVAQFKIGAKVGCYYNEIAYKVGEEYQLTITIPGRTLVIVMVGVSGACMLVVPIIVLIITLRKEREEITKGNRAMFTPQHRTEGDPLLAHKVKNSAQIQMRYSTDEDRA